MSMSSQQRREPTATGVKAGITPIKAVETQQSDDEILRVGHTGAIEWLFITDLLIDEGYQRYLNPERVNRIVADFDPDILGVLYVWRTPEGLLYCIDGQHRKAALVIKYGQRIQAQCVVYTDLTREGAANIFWKMNKWRLQPNSGAEFRARLMAGEPTALEIKAVCDEHGVIILLYPGELDQRHVQAIATLESIYRNKTLGAVLRVIRQSWPDEAGALKGRNMQGFDRLFTEFRHYFLGDDDNAEDRIKRLIKVVSQKTPRDILSRANYYRNEEDENATNAYARALHHFYNRGLQDQGYMRLPSWPTMPVSSLRPRRLLPASAYQEVVDGR